MGALVVAYLLILIVIAVMDGILGIKSIRKRTKTGQFLGFACIWATIIDLSYLCTILSTSYRFVSVMSSVYFMGIDGVLISLLIFTIYFTKGDFSRLEQLLTKACLCYAAFDFAVLAVNPFCHIAIDYVPRNTVISHYSYQMKLPYELHLCFSYAVLAIVLFLLVRKIFTTPHEYRSQYRLIVGGLLAVIGINAAFLYLPGDSILALLDCSICCYSLISFLLYWNCFDYATHGMLNKLKTRIFENIGQGIVLFDYENHIILQNSRADILLGREKLSQCRTLEDFLAKYSLPLQSSENFDSFSIRRRIESDDRTQMLRCDVKTLRNEKNDRLGLMFVFSDIAAETDILTGFQKWENFQPLAREAGEHFTFPVGIAVFDMNSLSVINATLGKEAGDEKIRQLSLLMKRIFPPETYFVRGTDANLIALCSRTDEEEMSGFAARIKQEFEESLQYGVDASSNQGQDLRGSIRSAAASMHNKKLVDHASIHSDMLSSLLKALEECDPDTEHHIQRTQKIGAELGKRIGLSDTQQSKLALLCLLHDIGKISIPIEILNKPGKLTDSEWKIMRSHVDAGYEIAMSNMDLRQVAPEIRYHHERWDGKGYPDGLSKESIPLLSRVISIVDSYDAMTNDRPYRKAMSVADAIEELRKNAGTQFDPSITADFIGLLLEKYSMEPLKEPVIPGSEAANAPSSEAAKSAAPEKVNFAAHPLHYSRYQLDRNWKIIKADDNFEELTGYSRQEAENGSLNQTDLIPEEDRLDYLSKTAASLAQNMFALNEHRLLRKDGSTIYVFCYGKEYHDAAQQTDYFDIVITDVSKTYSLKMLSDAVKNQADIRLHSWESTYRTDSLTGLLNHAAFRNDTEMKLLEGSSNAMMIMMDVDHFKQFNDTYGHQKGDEYLILIAQNLQSSLRGDDYACRMGGDEFAAMLFFNKSVSEDVMKERARQIFDKVNLVVKTTAGGTSVSMGAVIAHSMMAFHQLYNEADAALYKAKNGGRDRIVIEDAEGSGEKEA